MTDWDRFRRLTDADITKAISEDPDTFELTPEMWKHAKLVLPEKKATITMTIDRDVLAFFKKGGRGYQTRINAVLRSFMDAQDRARKPGKRKKAA
ncbi:MAG: BrnA antitoxin family protein [Alphaproteobacteria bacterium]|nr:BrnA antitoxin family protein [Alphaproteobacteria bacterium]